MTKPTAFLSSLCLALAGALVALVVHTPQAAAQPKKPKVTWEYRVFQMDPTDFKDKSDYRAILAQQGPRKVEAAFEEHVLKYLGKQGWELVTRERKAVTGVVYLYLKRRT